MSETYVTTFIFINIAGCTQALNASPFVFNNLSGYPCKFVSRGLASNGKTLTAKVT
jgi:hypothetical protein